MRRFRLLIAALTCAALWVLPLTLSAQKIDGGWREVDSLIEKQYYSQAYTLAEKLYDSAVARRDGHQSLIGAQRLSKIAGYYQENAADSSLARYRRLLPWLKGVDASLCRLQLASFYAMYYSCNQRRISQMDATDDAGADYKLWDKGRLQREAEVLVLSAFEDEVMLQSVGTESLGELVACMEGKDGILTPTVYDVACEKALEIAKLLDYTRLTIGDLPESEALFCDVSRFARMSVPEPVDTAKRMKYFVLKLLQRREALHLSRLESDGVLVALYRERQNWLPDLVVTIEEKKREEGLVEAVSYYGKHGSEHVAMLMADLVDMQCRTGRFVEAMGVIDSVLRHYPESPGGVRCYNQKQQIMRKEVSVTVEEPVPSNRCQLVCVATRNVEKVYFRVIHKVDHISKGSDEKQRAFLLSQKVLEQWSQSIELQGDYKDQRTYGVMPAMAQGDYLLLASCDADFKKEGISVTQFAVRDWAFIPAKYEGNCQAGFLLDRTSGKPVKNQAVTLQYRKGYGNQYVDCATMNTGSDGYYDFTERITESLLRHYDFRVKTMCEGEEVVEQMYGLRKGDKERERDGRMYVFLDRPIYRPGDTVHIELLSYAVDRYDGLVQEDRNVVLKIRDVNYKVQDMLQIVTDAYGSARGEFVIPSDALPGSWSIRNEEENLYAAIRVEAYKQPKFAVTLTVSSEERHFGQAVRVGGVAASYSAVPIGNAKVSYSVHRKELCPLWRWGWWRWWEPMLEDRVVATGETTTDVQGLFEVTFTPWPDSNVDFGRKPSFRYTVEATVTDINGESHEAQTSLSVGFENSYVQIDSESGATELQAVRVSCHNLDGAAIGGELQLEVERLQRPAAPKLMHPVMEKFKDARMPMTRGEFEALFPMFDYDGSYDDISRWPVEKRVYSTTVRLTEKEDYRYETKGLAAGCYRITAKVKTASGEEVSAVSYMTYEPWTSQKPNEDLLAALEVDKKRCEVGDTVHLKVGSAFDDVTLYVLINKSEVSYRHLLKRVSNGYTKIAVPVDGNMLGGFNIEVAAVKENIIDYDQVQIEVPYSHKDLEVTLETFRNKLEPGQQEQWTVRIKGKQDGKPQTAHLLMTMYDHALDSYNNLNWVLNPWWQSYTGSVFGDLSDLEYGYYYCRPQLSRKSYIDYSFASCLLKGDAPCVSMMGNVRMRMNKSMGGTARGEDGMVDYDVVEVKAYKMATDEEVIMEEELYSFGTAESAMALNTVQLADNAEEENEEEHEHNRTGAEKTNMYLRQNMSTLTFFRSMESDSTDGSVTLAFTAPDLLTEWSIRGIAWSRDMKVGSLSASAITQKQLMVVPNVPRFLRHGDTCRFSVKVSNMSDKEQDIAVTLTMEDAADNAPLQMVVGDAVQHIRLAAGTSGEVSFLLAVPQAAVFVTNYRIVARGDGCSDGEQAPIPLLPSRQLVTESMAFYINGKGEKKYEMQHLTHLYDGDTTGMTLRHYGLTVDVTPNPVWLAMQSLPYVSQKENPSNIYLVNSYYTNSLSLGIVKNNPMVEQLFETWRKEEPDAMLSALDRNSDLKQTVMEETPWLRDALSEEQRHREVAHFFEPLPLERQMQKDMDKLLDAQRGDGGWSWIAGGRWSCLYTTQYILKTLGLLQQQGVSLDGRTRKALDQALSYVDRETYNYYKRYLKGHDCEPVNLDYLYVRSFYADNKMDKNSKEAYNYFYNNAKKRNKDFQSLYSQAELALVFHRHGDRELAREMAVRIREKALESDEMGMYWRDNRSGWCWNERPIETQAMLIRVFDEVLGDSENVVKMQQWLLKQKQTTNWNTDVATVNAIQALLLDGKRKETVVAKPVRMEPSQLTVCYGKHELKSDTSRLQLHLSQRLAADEITPADGILIVQKADQGIAWGALYWQYFEQVDKIPSSNMGVMLKRTLYRIESDGSLKKIGDDKQLKVGDKVRVRLEIATDRNLEYLELKEPRCAAFEPVNTQSGWRWGSGLSYYRSVTNAAQTLYIDRLEKGSYVVETDYYVNNAGVYRTAPTVMQCLYAPEFRAILAMPSLRVGR